MAQAASLLFSAICTALLVGFIIAEALTREAMMDSSAEAQEDLQSDSKAAKDFFAFIATASLIVTFAVQAIVYYGLSSSLGLSLVLITSLGASMPNLIKMAYCNPRPYWAYDHVEALACEGGWGNPSGHTFCTGTVWLCFSVLLAVKGKAIWIGLVLLWILLVGLDRVYLGVHFYSQVILGWSFGLGIAGVYVHIWKSGVPKQRFISTILYHIAAFLYGLICVLLFVFREPYWNEAWSERIDLKCDMSYSVSDAQGSAFMETSLFAFFPGALLGFVIIEKKFPNFESIYLPIKKRVILIVVSFLPLLLQGGFCNNHVVMLSKSYLKSVPWGGWALTLFISYISGLLFTAAVPLLRLLFQTEPSPLARAVYDEKQPE
jgi:membrane-associated phospholipid phosphatase